MGHLFDESKLPLLNMCLVGDGPRAPPYKALPSCLLLLPLLRLSSDPDAAPLNRLVLLSSRLVLLSSRLPRSWWSSFSRLSTLPSAMFMSEDIREGIFRKACIVAAKADEKQAGSSMHAWRVVR